MHEGGREGGRETSDDTSTTIPLSSHARWVGYKSGTSRWNDYNALIPCWGTLPATAIYSCMYQHCTCPGLMVIMISSSASTADTCTCIHTRLEHTSERNREMGCKKGRRRSRSRRRRRRRRGKRRGRRSRRRRGRRRREMFHPQAKVLLLELFPVSGHLVGRVHGHRLVSWR